MSSRIISVEEINTVTAAISDKVGIELLREIRDNVTSESDLPEQKSKKDGVKTDEKELEREQETRAFIGFTKEEDVVSGDLESKKGVLKRLEDNGLILKGGYIPKGKERVNSYKLTNEGYALLTLVDKIEGYTSNSGSGGTGGRRSGRKSRAAENNKETQNNSKDEELSNVVEENNKEEDKEIASFKTNTKKEYDI